MSDSSHSSDSDKDCCLSQLYTMLASLGTNQPNEFARIERWSHIEHFRTDDHLHQAGDIASHIFFICSGLVRFYYLTEDGKELNKSFSLENQFAGALQYSIHPQPGRFHIQALEPTQTLAIAIEGLNQLYAESLVWANIGRLYMETVAVRKTRREEEFLFETAESRYLRFLQENPELARRLPLYHIASFLGITDVALSRIRARLKKSET